jgi:hypothetical protein
MGLKNKRLLLVKKETTYGTDATPVVGTNAILCGSLEIQPIQGDKVQRNIIRPYFGNQADIQTTTYATVSFEVEFAGSGAAGTAPQYGPLLQACGMAETVTSSTKVEYLPVSASFASVSIYFQADGLKHILLGAMGTVSWDLTAGQLPKMKYTFTGLLGTISDNAMPSNPTYTSVVPVPVSTTNTTPAEIFGYTPILDMFSLDLANAVTYRNLVNDQRVLITGRAPKGQVKLDVPTIASKDFFTLVKNATVGTISIQHGQSAGNIVVIDSATNGVTPSGLTYADRDNVDQIQMDLSFVPVSGNDEVKITVK